MSKFYITTPIYYVNSRPHLGHLYTTIVADTMARYQRQRGVESFFLTGTDEHGQNIERAAERAEVPVRQYVDGIVAEFQEMFSQFRLGFDQWIRTTDPAHQEGVKALWRRVRENGYIYKGQYEGWYCVGCNGFLSEDETVPGAEGHRSVGHTNAPSSGWRRRATSFVSRRSRSGFWPGTRRTRSLSSPKRAATKFCVLSRAGFTISLSAGSR
jgi:methionyl-tRNA synthetase